MSDQAFDVKGEMPRALDHIVVADFDGGEGVLVDLNTTRYYQLNETAMLVWRGLQQGRDFDEIVKEMTADYDVAPERARESVRKILNNFLTLKLVGRG